MLIGRVCRPRVAASPPPPVRLHRTKPTEGELGVGELRVTVESDLLVAFGDGVDSDALELSWGQTVRLCVAAERLCVVIPA